MRLDFFSLPEPSAEPISPSRQVDQPPSSPRADLALEAIEKECQQLGERARRLGLRHVDFLLKVAAQEIASRRS